jgi:hypothetical protein
MRTKDRINRDMKCQLNAAAGTTSHGRGRRDHSSARPPPSKQCLLAVRTCPAGEEAMAASIDAIAFVDDLVYFIILHW